MSLWNLQDVASALRATDGLKVEGRVVRASGLVIEASLPHASVGDLCTLKLRGGRNMKAQVVGVSGKGALLMPFGNLTGVHAGSAVEAGGAGDELMLGPQLLGRVLNAELEPLDGRPLPAGLQPHALHASAPLALERRRVQKPLGLGIRVLDTMLTCGEGQRVGIMAGPGVGKSVLLGMLARTAQSDVNVLALIGERGREVRDFLERDLQAEGLARSVVIVATSDESPMLRVRAAQVATAVAEHFRGMGKKVLLMLDSLTRVAMAQREIGLAVHEPPTSKGYPPSVFSLLPRLLERAGNDGGQGSITGFYTVLAEGDDLSDPVVDSARSLLDGHVVLSRTLANRGHFPAVDVLQSVSRVMTDVVSPQHQEVARAAREVLATHAEHADLVELGAYHKGQNPKLDHALAVLPALNTLFRQAAEERTPLADSLQRLSALLTRLTAPTPHHEPAPRRP
jgi:flagellum-specific ATP synthase